ncbi:hypothetical protein GQ55_5G111800 [Panicum hallii var. hallii]|uniref:Uncharacterized protein n=1 Tax=Panicum hallii var. hallii TaxID=1504633 RepID=A0A2T7DF38_9POAL|nr:hypothetical protein GQ55_5G111800 [Panicum hallii var. hallii]
MKMLLCWRKKMPKEQIGLLLSKSNRIRSGRKQCGPHKANQTLFFTRRGPYKYMLFLFILSRISSFFSFFFEASFFSSRVQILATIHNNLLPFIQP